MTYATVYSECYSRNYTRFEYIIKKFLLRQKEERRTSGFAIREVRNYLANDFKEKFSFYESPILELLYEKFQDRNRHYVDDYAIQGILENEIKNQFDEIDMTKLPKSYSYERFIKEAALLEVEREISRLFDILISHLPLYFDANDFSDFEIRDHKRLSPDDFPVFIKLRKKLPPTHAYYLPTVDVPVHSGALLRDNNKKHFTFIKYSFLFKNEDVFNAFIIYQRHIIDSYVDFSYLKKRLEHENLIYSITDNYFMKIVYESLELISEKQYDIYIERGKLKSLSKSFSEQRENNFNHIFKV